MKILFLFLISAVVVPCFITCILLAKEDTSPKPHIDLPEEWQAISVDRLKPDTLICYRSKDSLYFAFKPK